MAKLITPTLISSIDWLKKAPMSPTKKNPKITWKQKAYDDLVGILSRIWPKETPSYIQRGIDFENAVQKVVEANSVGIVKSSEHFKTVCKACEGGVFQKKTKSIVEIDGVEYCLYGKIDVDLPTKIVDIKTTGNFKKDSYTKSYQHKIYCLNEQKEHFNYVVAEFDEDNKTIKDVHTVAYKVENFKELEEDVHDKVREVIEFLQCDEDLWELYTKKFNQF